MRKLQSRRSSVENLEKRLLLVNPVNHVPGTQTVIEDTVLVFSGGTNNRITITDVDGPGPFEVELNSVNGTAQIANNPTVTITGNGTNAVRIIGALSNVNIAIANILFRPNNGFEGNATLQVETDDQDGPGGLTDTDNINITVTPNASPVNFVPGGQTTGMNSPLRFSAATGNPFSFTDIDGPGPFEVELNPTNGIVTVASTAGVTVTGNGTNNVTVVGTLNNVNSAISDFTYTPTLGFTGTSLVAIETDDLDGTGGRSDTNFTQVRVVNGTPPLVNTSKFDFETNHAFEFKFNHAIDDNTLNNNDISIRSLPNHQSVSITMGTINYNPANFTVRYNLANPLPDGNYEYRLLNNALADTNGFTNGEYVQPFYVLAGDANRDRSVDFDDLLIVAQNYGQSNRTFSQGNFDYSVNGLVSFPDLLIVAQHYGDSVPAAILGFRFSSKRIGDDVLSISRASR